MLVWRGEFLSKESVVETLELKFPIEVLRISQINKRDIRRVASITNTSLIIPVFVQNTIL